MFTTRLTKPSQASLGLFSLISAFIICLLTACVENPTEPGSNPAEPGSIPNILMVTIPGGTFQMGSNWEVDPNNPYRGKGWFTNEQPVHEVTVSAFQMGQYEITHSQYQAVVGGNPSYFKGDTKRPVEQVSWSDAVKFCNKLSQLSGLDSCYSFTIIHIRPLVLRASCDFTKNGYRLPTEAEWEYACRAGTTTLYYTGDNKSDLDKAGWYSENSGGSTHAVGGKQANAFGLYDMHGNVQEWCNDLWSSIYAGASQTDPTGPVSGSTYVRRGGSWVSIVIYGDCRSAVRTNYGQDNRSNFLGFRVVRR